MANTMKRRSYDPYRNMSYAYDGSAARVLEQEEVLRPRPQPRVRPRHAQLERPKVEVRPAGKVSLFAVAGAVMILMSTVQLMSVSDEVVSIENQIRELKSEEATLLARYEMAYDLGAIESAVTADGSMSRPQAGQIIYVDLTEPDSVVLYSQTEAAEGLWGSITQFWDSLLAYF